MDIFIPLSPYRLCISKNGPPEAARTTMVEEPELCARGATLIFSCADARGDTFRSHPLRHFLEHHFGRAAADRLHARVALHHEILPATAEELRIAVETKVEGVWGEGLIGKVVLVERTN
ncbi:MAG: hypothetical protein KF748_13425 [Xanthobacteraceae bacterium]|nr:hypothetical protein [Xanthobacteraceae bacterium]